MKLSKIIFSCIILMFLWCSPSFAADTCQHDGSGDGDGTNYDCTACAYNETGICRMVKDLTATKVQATITASSSSGTGLAANGATFNGDGVYMPAGTASWSSGVTISGRNIVLAGQGDTTNITLAGGSGVYVSGTNPARYQFRLTHFKFSGATSGIPINIFPQDNTNTTIPAGWRIDNITIDVTGGGNPIDIQGLTYGLIDHCTIKRDGKALRLSGYANKLDTGIGSITRVRGTYERARATGLGNNEAVYVEDCILINIANNSAPVAEEIDLGGGSLVLRYNTIWHGELFGKMTRSGSPNPQYGPRKLEAYSNKFYGTCDNAYCSSSLPTVEQFARFSGGTGILYNNQVTGFTNNTFLLDDYRAMPANCITLMGWDDDPYKCCDGTLTNTWDGNKECSNGTSIEAANPDGSCPSAGYTNTGYPCSGQPGRGTGSPGSEASEPWYAWKNGAEATCLTGGTCTNSITFTTPIPLYIRASTSPHAITGSPYEYVDNTQKDGYTAYTYPHPLQGESDPLPKAVTSLVVNSVGGSVSSSQTVDSGSTAQFTYNAHNGWKFKAWGGTCGGSGTTTYTTNAVTADCNVTVEFEQITLNTFCR